MLLLLLIIFVLPLSIVVSAHTHSATLDQLDLMIFDFSAELSKPKKLLLIGLDGVANDCCCCWRFAEGFL